MLDNKEPRLFARTVNIKVMGTIGTIKLAWQRGLIKDPVKELNRLRLIYEDVTRAFTLNARRVTGEYVYFLLYGNNKFKEDIENRFGRKFEIKKAGRRPKM